MNQPVPDSGSGEVARLGEAKLVCRTSRKTLFWGFLVVSLLSGAGIALLVIVLTWLVSDWSKDVFGSLVFVAVGVFLLWGGGVLWRKTNCLRHTRAVVHAHGLSYRKDNTTLTCRWEDIQEIRCLERDHYEETAAVGLIPIPRGTTTPTFVHSSHHLTVRRKDGLELVFTDELEDVVGLASAIQQETTPWNPRWVHDQTVSKAAVTKRG
jgi:hypothetical protein